MNVESVLADMRRTSRGAEGYGSRAAGLPIDRAGKMGSEGAERAREMEMEGKGGAAGTKWRVMRREIRTSRNMTKPPREKHPHSTGSTFPADRGLTLHMKRCLTTASSTAHAMGLRASVMVRGAKICMEGDGTATPQEETARTRKTPVEFRATCADNKIVGTPSRSRPHRCPN